MAKALKCNRCGMFFTTDELEDALMCRFRNPIFQNGPDAMSGKVSSRLISDGDPEEIIDLCPRCTTEFFIFMNPWTRDENTEDDG